MNNSENKKDESKQSNAAKPFDGADSETIARDIKEGRLSCFVGGGTTLNGELSFDSMARIDGHLTGKIKSEKGTLIVGVNGQVDASVAVATAVINGTVNGDVTTSEHLELKSTAKILGNVKTPRLVMEDGAILEGNCGMLKPADKPDPRAEKQTAAAQTFRSGQSPRPNENPVKDKKAFEPIEANPQQSPLTLEVV